MYSAPWRDPRFHAVTVVVGVTVSEPARSASVNPVEISEVKLFRDAELPAEMSQGMDDVLQNARSKSVVWE